MSWESEKRAFTRVDVECRVSFAVGPQPDESKRKYVTVDAKDLSTEGIGFESPEELPVGTFLHMTLDFPARQSILRIRGEVRRCVHSHRSKSAYLIGVKFFGSPEGLAKTFMSCL